MPPTLWYYEHDGKSGGPVTVSQLRQLAGGGQLLPADKVRKDDMTKWVKARSVKGLFAAPADAGGGDLLSAPSTIEGEIETGASVFDFFAGGAGAAAAPPAHVPPEENTVFDFFNPCPAPAAAAVGDDDEPRPLAGPPPAAIPTAAAVLDEVSGPAVELLADDCVALTGGRTTIRLAGRWLRAKTTGGDGERLACLRLSKLEAAVLGPRAEAGPKGVRRGTHRVLSFHVGTQSLAVACADGDKRYRGFLDRVLAWKG